MRHLSVTLLVEFADADTAQKANYRADTDNRSDNRCITTHYISHNLNVRQHKQVRKGHIQDVASKADGTQQQFRLGQISTQSMSCASYLKYSYCRPIF